MTVGLEVFVQRRDRGDRHRARCGSCRLAADRRSRSADTRGVSTGHADRRGRCGRAALRRRLRENDGGSLAGNDASDASSTASLLSRLLDAGCAGASRPFGKSTGSCRAGPSARRGPAAAAGRRPTGSTVARSSSSSASKSGRRRAPATGPAPWRSARPARPAPRSGRSGAGRPASRRRSGRASAVAPNSGLMLLIVARSASDSAGQPVAGELDERADDAVARGASR